MKYGDKVTYLDKSLLVHARWGNHRDRGRSFADAYELIRGGVAGAVHATCVALADEGVTWCREHVSEKDEAGAALLAYGRLQ